MSFAEFMDDFWEEKAQDIQLGMICKIEKFDKKTMRADVQPLLKLKNSLDVETTFPILADLPVMYFNGGGFYIRPVYSRGDMVWVSFSTHDTADALNGYTRAASEKIFSIDNACVVGGIAKNIFTAPPEFNTDKGLLIGHEDGNSYIKFEKDKITFKFSGAVETVELSAQGIKFPTFNLKTHNHSTSAPGAPTGPPTPGS